MTSRWHNDFKSTHNGKAPVQTQQNARRKPRLLSDDHIEALREFADDQSSLLGYYPDSKVFGLNIFLGAKSTVWRFRQQSRIKGKRSSVFKTLGNWLRWTLMRRADKPSYIPAPSPLAPLPRASVKRCRSKRLLKITSCISRYKPRRRGSRRAGGSPPPSFPRRTSCHNGKDGHSLRCRRPHEP